MIRVLKIGNYIYENIEPYFVDKNGNTVWIIPQDLNQLKQCVADTMAWLEKQRLQKILDQYRYNSLGDVVFYANKNDPEAQSLLAWYKQYDDNIWKWIEGELPKYQTVDALLSLNLVEIEEQLFQSAVQTASLP